MYNVYQQTSPTPRAIKVDKEKNFINIYQVAIMKNFPEHTEIRQNCVFVIFFDFFVRFPA